MHLKKAEKEFYHSLLEKAGTKGKLIWETINICLGRQKTAGNDTNKITYKGKEYTDNADIADCFNHYFKFVAKDLADKIEPCNHFSDFLNASKKTENTFNFEPTNYLRIFRIIPSILPIILFDTYSYAKAQQKY